MASLPFSSSSTPSFSHFLPTISPRLHLQPANFPIPYKCYLHNISSLCKQGQIQAALNLLTQMDLQSLPVGPQIYGELLQGCLYERDFHTGQQIHSRVIKNGDLFSTDEYIGTKLLAFYAKCDRLEIADQLFVKLRVKNVFSWSAIIGLRCRLGLNEEAMMDLCDMIISGISADNFLVPNVMKACGSLGWIRFGRGVHGYAVKMDLDKCIFVSSSLVHMYGKCGALDDAQKVFAKMPQRNVVTWNSMIVGYVQNGFNQEAIQTFYYMRLEDIEHTQVTLSAFLSACANIGAIEEGKQGHAIAITVGLELDNMLGSSILNFYSKIGLITYAELVFSKMLEKDIVAWNVLISCYVEGNQAPKALDMCQAMRLNNVKFDSVTLASIFSIYAKTKNIELGKECHSYCIRNNLQSNPDVASGIQIMYINCEKIDKARNFFDSIVKKDLTLWNIMLNSYAERGLAGETLRLFYQMQLESVPPNVTSWNAVILGLIRSGQVSKAKEMVFEMQAAGSGPNFVTLTTLISGFVENGLENEALLLQQGREIHGYIVRHGFWLEISIANALSEMYVKFGNVEQGRRVFDMISIKENLAYNLNGSCLSQLLPV